jgi:hypothetical protein
MKVKKIRTTKRVGRPLIADKALPMRQLRMSKEQSDAITAWARRQSDKPNWSEAVRRLLQAALDGLKR